MSANYAAGSSQVLTADTNSSDSADSGSGMGGDTQSTGSGNGHGPVWQMAGKALIILLVIFGLVLGGRWVWGNYSGDDSPASDTPVAIDPQPLPINSVEPIEPDPQPVVDADGDIPPLGVANPLAMTAGAAILAAALYRFGNFAHQSNRR